jgi:hypothetical protein
MARKKSYPPGALVRAEVAGHPEDVLTIGCGIAKCGFIDDGVWMEHGRSGGWVIPFHALEAAYLAAKAYRKRWG